MGMRKCILGVFAASGMRTEDVDGQCACISDSSQSRNMGVGIKKGL